MQHISQLTTYIYLLVFLAMATVAWTGCVRKPPSKTKEQVMQEKLAERLQRWYADLEANCNRKVMESAAAIVDSTLLADARFKRDTSDLPSIPGRPEKPAFTPPSDSTPIKPILGTKGDSLK